MIFITAGRDVMGKKRRECWVKVRCGEKMGWMGKKRRESLSRSRIRDELTVGRKEV